jgi:c-di-GMP-binding flagellar brake protein YcgR
MNAKGTNDPERRRYPRIKTKLPVELRCSDKSHMRTTTDEVSLCGCYIETMFTIEIGTKVELVLSLNQGKVIAKGVVVTKTPQVGNGIDFVEMDEDSRLKLRDYIDECERRAEG